MYIKIEYIDYLHYISRLLLRIIKLQCLRTMHLQSINSFLFNLFIIRSVLSTLMNINKYLYLQISNVYTYITLKGTRAIYI